jgi:hypothetical protein
MVRASLAMLLVIGMASAGDAPVPQVPAPPVVPAESTTAEAAAADAAGPVQPALITISAGQGGVMSFNEKEPTKLGGGVKLGYEQVEVLCDHLDYWQSKLPGAKRALLDHARFAPGPDAVDPEHVVFDTRRSRLPQVAFRGLMTPREVEVIRQALDPAAPTRAYFRVLLHQLGGFSGDLQTSDGWAPHGGWAEEAELMVVGDVVPGGVATRGSPR